VTYELTINETHAQVLINALELYSRMGMGQLSFLMEHQDLQKRLVVGPDSHFETVRGTLEFLKKIIFPELPLNGYYSISSPEINDANRVAYEMLQVVRHRMAWDRLQGKQPSGFSVIYDEPMKTSAQPLPTIRQVTP